MLSFCAHRSKGADRLEVRLAGGEAGGRAGTRLDPFQTLDPKMTLSWYGAHRIKGADRLEVRLAGDEAGGRAGTGLGFALQQLLVGLPAVTVAGIPTVERAVVTYDDKARRCA